MFEDYKRLLAAVTALEPGTPEHHQEALTASVQALLLVEAIDPDGSLPREAVYRHLANVAVDEMLPANPVGLSKPTLTVVLPPGRLNGSRPTVRAQLIEEIRNRRPAMSDREIDRRGVELGWWEDALGDYAMIARRVRRIKKDATN